MRILIAVIVMEQKSRHTLKEIIKKGTHKQSIHKETYAPPCSLATNSLLKL